MLISLSPCLISNALNLKKDKSILFSRTVMVSVVLISFLALNTNFSKAIIKLLTVFKAALDNVFIFIALVGILTSVISAVYYLNVIKKTFFFKYNNLINPSLDNLNLVATCEKTRVHRETQVNFKIENIVLSGALSSVISILTLILLLFIYIPNEWFSIANILTLTLFNE